MLDYFKSAIDFLTAHPNLAYTLVFLAAFFEAVPLMGSIIPGATIVVGVSALASTGAVEFWPLLLWASLGAALGDGFSYWLGRRYQRQILETWPIRNYPALTRRAEEFFHRHGGKSIVFGRFIPPLRPFVPVIAGMLRMPAWRFYPANIFSALLWAVAHILPGMALGATLGLAAAVAGRLMLLGVAILLLLWGIVWLSGQALRRGLPCFLALLDLGHGWARRHENWLLRQLAGVLDPRQPEIRGLAFAGVFLVGATWLFFGILEDVVTGDPLVRADAAIYGLLQGLRSPTGDAWMVGLTELGDTRVVIAVALAVLAWLLFRRAFRTAAYWSAAIGLASLFNSLIKLALSRARPHLSLYDGVGTFSFPSGHATVNAVMYGFLGYLLARRLRPLWRMPVIAALAGLVGLIAFSRLYLGAHWLSDVAGGLAFGAAWVALLGTAYHFHRPERVSPGALMIVAALALFVAGGVHIQRQHAADLARYAEQVESVSIPAADWRNEGWVRAAEFRENLIGEFAAPLTVQWMGGLADLESRLAQGGWRRPAPWSAASVLAWISPNPDQAMMPVLPLLHQGAWPALSLIRLSEDGSRLVLRMWPSGAGITAPGGKVQPLWIGSVIEERLDRSIWPVALDIGQPDFNRSRDALGRTLGLGRLGFRPGVAPDGNWDGGVWLAAAPGTL